MCSVRSLAFLPLSRSSLSRRCNISGVNGIGSLPLLPLALDEAHVVPSLRMLELRGSLFLPLDMLAWSPSGSNLFGRGIAPPLAAAACPRAYGIVGGAGAPKLRRVTTAGAPDCPCDRVVAATVGPVPPVWIC